MRISFQNQYSSYLRDINRAQEAMFSAQTQVSTGRRLNSLGDDPVGVTTSLTLKGLKSGLTQYSANLTTAKGQLGFTDTNLDESQKLVRRAYELSVSGANGTATQDSRAAMAQEISTLQTRLVDLANGKGPSDQYLYAGQKIDTQPFTVTSTGLTYNGDDKSIDVEISPDHTLTVNTQGKNLFTDAYNRLQALKDHLTGGDTASLTNDIGELQKSDTAMSLARSEVGAKLSSVTEQLTHHTRRMDDLTEQISNVEDADMSVAIVQYTQAQTSYQAALQSVSSSSNLSLLNFLQ